MLRIRKLELPNNVQIVTSNSTVDGFHWTKVKHICDKQGIAFNNQSIGTLRIQLQKQFLEPKRKTFTATERTLLKEAQNSKCNVCSKTLGQTFHVDHIQPLCTGGSNNDDNLQVLCESCHIHKTQREAIRTSKNSSVIQSLSEQEGRP